MFRSLALFLLVLGFGPVALAAQSKDKERTVYNTDPEGLPPAWKARKSRTAFKLEAVTITWDYDRTDAVNGPSGWSTLATGGAACGSTSQSPINILNARYTTLGTSTQYAQYDSTLTPISVNWNTYPAATTAVENNGHAIEVLPAATDLSSSFTGGPLTDTYSMTQFHFHYISEHQVNGASFAAELHIVGTTENAADANGGPSNLAVIGIFFEEDPNPNAALNAGLTAILNAATTGSLTTLGASAPVSLSLSSFWNTSSSNSFYTYQGSLTTPPCTQDVIWTVLQQPLLIPGVQLQALRQLLAITSQIGPFTNRPVQALNGRTVRSSTALLAVPPTPTSAPSSGPSISASGSLTGTFAVAPGGNTALASISINQQSTTGPSVTTSPALATNPSLAGSYLITVPNSVTQVLFTVNTNIYTAQIQYRWSPNYPSPAALYPNAGLSANAYTCDQCAGGSAITCNSNTGPGSSPSPSLGFACASLSRQYLFSNLVVSTSSTPVANAFSLQLFDLNASPDTSSYSFTVVRTAPITVVGDPQIVGIQGQDFQVHGMPDTVFNLISSPSLQVNSLFVYRSSGECIDDFTACFAHPGTYIGVSGAMVGPVRIRVSAGSASRGLRLSINGERVPVDVNSSIPLSRYAASASASRLVVVSHRRVSIETPLLKLTISNSDHFINHDIELNEQRYKQAGQKRVTLSPGSRYPVPSSASDLLLHGLQGQTWKNAEYASGLEYEGSIMDYQIADGDLFGTDFVFNLFDKQLFQ